LDSEEKIATYLDIKRSQHLEQFIESGEDIDSHIAKYANRLRNDLSKLQEDYNNLYSDGVDNFYGVLSLSERWDSILMWSHYGDFHKGYCVGFWEEKLRNSIYATGGRVMYPKDNKFPEISPLEQDDAKIMIIQTHAKSEEWSYEKEYRLAKLFYPNIPTVADRIEVIADDFFAEIVIGINASQQTKEELIQIAKSKNVKIYQAVKIPFKFELTRNQL
jgi:Protein of unknown function (DUF2971)